MIITLSVSVELTYLHILGGKLYSIRKQCTLQVLLGHKIRCVQVGIVLKRHFSSTTYCIVSCILDSWVAYGLVILFHSFYAYYYFQFWTPKLIIYEFCVQEGPAIPLIFGIQIEIQFQYKECTWYIQMDITVLTSETICVQWPSSSFYYLDVILGQGLKSLREILFDFYQLLLV